MRRSVAGVMAILAVAATIQAAQTAAVDDIAGAAFLMVMALGSITCGIYLRGKDGLSN